MSDAPSTDAPWKDQITQIINDRLRPAIQNDGGDLELVEISDDGVVKVRLHGACVGCPGARMTLKMGVERALKQFVPQVKEVVTAS